MSAVPSATISQEKNQICLLNLRHLKAVEQSSWNTRLMQNIARLVEFVFPAFDGDVDGTLKFSRLNCERWHSIQTHTAPQLLIESATGRCGGSGVSKTTSCQDDAETSTKTSLQHSPPPKNSGKTYKNLFKSRFLFGSQRLWRLLLTATRLHNKWNKSFLVSSQTRCLPYWV